MSQELTLPERAIQALAAAPAEDQLQELASSTHDLTDITDETGLQLLNISIGKLTKVRNRILTVGKTARQDARDYATAIIAREKTLISILEPEETRLKAIRKSYEAKLAAIAQAEHTRKMALWSQLEEWRAVAERLKGKTTTEIEARLNELNITYLEEETWGELYNQAHILLAAARQTTQQELDTTRQREQAEAEARQQEQAEAEVRQWEQQRLIQERAAIKLEALQLGQERKRLEEQRRLQEWQQQALARQRQDAGWIEATPTPTAADRKTATEELKEETAAKQTAMELKYSDLKLDEAIEIWRSNFAISQEAITELTNLLRYFGIEPHEVSSI